MLRDNYMQKSLKISEELMIQLQSEECEMTLVHRLMEKNGWDFPTGKDDCSDYDQAVNEVKWFIHQLLDLGKV